MTDAAGPSGLFRKRVKALTKAARRIDEGDIEAVHGTRVTTRRLRELLPVLGFDSGTARKLSRRLKKTTKQLGDVRQFDVLTQIAQELGQDARYSAAALRQVTTAVESDRVAARDRLAERLPFERIERLARRLRRAMKRRESHERGHAPGAHGPKRGWMWALEARAVRRATDVRRAIEIAGTVYVPGRLHDARIAVKKLRYAMEVAAEARARREGPDVAVLRAAQDSLGRLHDLEVLIERAHDEQARLSPPNVTAWRELDSLVEALEDDCRTIHAHYLHERPKLIAIADRVCDSKGHAVFVTRRAAG
jgi:CHAD domain-containing protein